MTPTDLRALAADHGAIRMRPHETSAALLAAADEIDELSLEHEAADAALDVAADEVHRLHAYATAAVLEDRERYRPAGDEAVRDAARGEDPGGEDLCRWSFERGWRAAEDSLRITQAVGVSND